MGRTKSFQLSFNPLLSLFFGRVTVPEEEVSGVMRPVNKGLGLEPHPLSLPGSGRHKATGESTQPQFCHLEAGAAERKSAPLLWGHKPQVHGGRLRSACPYLQTCSTFPGITSSCLILTKAQGTE